MGVRVLCDRCGKSYEFKPEHIGKRFRCKGCDKVLEVKDLISEFENLEADSSLVIPPSPFSEPAKDSTYSITANDEGNSPQEEEIVERKKEPKAKKKKKAKSTDDDKAEQDWESRLAIKENTFESPGQVILKLIIKHRVLVISVITVILLFFILFIYLVFFIV